MLAIVLAFNAATTNADPVPLYVGRDNQAAKEILKAGGPGVARAELYLNPQYTQRRFFTDEKLVGSPSESVIEQDESATQIRIAELEAALKDMTEERDKALKENQSLKEIIDTKFWEGVEKGKTDAAKEKPAPAPAEKSDKPAEEKPAGQTDLKLPAKPSSGGGSNK